MSPIEMVAWTGATSLAIASASNYAVRGRSSAVFGPSVYHGARDRRSVALTFDDGPSESTPRILEILAHSGVNGTFFQCGVNVRRLPEIARQVSAAGNEIGNHTETHSPLWLKHPGFVRTEVAAAQGVLAEVHGEAPRLFRAPYGVRWFGLREIQARLGLLGVMWTTIGLDWKLPGRRVSRILRNGLANGAILCLHDGRETRRNPDVGATVEALRELMPVILSEGYRLETVSEILCPTT